MNATATPVVNDIPGFLAVAFEYSPAYVLVAKMSDMLRVDSRMLRPLAAFLSAHCYRINAMTVVRDRQMMSGYGRIAEIGLVTECVGEDCCAGLHCKHVRSIHGLDGLFQTPN